MADADSQEQTSQSQEQTTSTGNQAADQQFAQVAKMLESMNKSFSEGLAQVAAAVKPQPAPRPQARTEEIDDDDIYQPKKLADKVLRRTDDIVNQALAKERALNSMIYNLSQEYPEIQSNDDVRQAVIKAHNAIPETLRDTAEGYEMAVLRAVSSAGIVPKSKRPTVDPDVSLGAGRGTSSSKPKARAKVTEEVLQIAQLLGRDISDKSVLKGLEDAMNRDTYSKYR